MQQLNRLGLVVVSRAVVQDPPPEGAWLPAGESAGVSVVNAAQIAVLALIIAALVTEVVLLAGPAFAVGVRRQRRDLALVAATGGAPRDLRRTVLASGVVLGGGAAVLGAVLGVGLARVAVPVLESRTTMLFGPFDVPWLHVLLTVAVGVVAGLAAAYVPARQAGRTDVVDALAGRRGQVRSSWKLPVVGLVVVAAGMVLVVLGARGTELGVAGGAVLLVLGLVIATPWLIGLLAPLGRVLPVPGRLAVRDATRNRSRTAPAVAAVMATVTGVTALVIGSTSDSAQARRDYVAQAPMGAAVISADVDAGGWAALMEIVHDQAPDQQVHRIEAMPWSTADGPQLDLGIVQDGCTGGLLPCRWSPAGNLVTTQRDIVVADSAAVRALDQGDVPDRAFDVLDEGRAVVLGRGAVHADGTVTLVEEEFAATGGSTVLSTVRLPAVQVPVPGGRPDALLRVPALVIVPPGLAARLPAEVSTAALVVGGPDRPVTPALQSRLEERLAALTSQESIYVERGWTDEQAVARWLLLGVGALLVLIATLTATGLALTDARPDFATLAAIGAAPRTRRFMAMCTAGLIGGGGALVGVLVGLAPGIAVAYPLTTNDYGSGAPHPVIDVPWLVLAGIAVVVPLLAVAVTGLFVRSKLPMATRIA